MACIVEGDLPQGQGYYVDLWEDPDTPSTAFEFHEVKTEEEKKQLIKELAAKGHQPPGEY